MKNTILYIALAVFGLLLLAYVNRNRNTILSSVNDSNIKPGTTPAPVGTNGNKALEVYRASSGNPSSPGTIAVYGRNGANVDRVKIEVRDQTDKLISSSSIGFSAFTRPRTYSIPAGVTALQIKMISTFEDGTTAATILNQPVA